MQVEQTRLFRRDIRRIGSAQLRHQVDLRIQELAAAPTIRDVGGVRRMVGGGEHYRIRIGDYRLGITMHGETAILRRFLPRGEIYRYFP